MTKTCGFVAVEDLGLDLRYGGRSLLDFKLAYNISMFGKNLWKTENLVAMGLQLNVDKIKSFTSQAQPPNGLDDN